MISDWRGGTTAVFSPGLIFHFLSQVLLNNILQCLGIMGFPVQLVKTGITPTQLLECLNLQPFHTVWNPKGIPGEISSEYSLEGLMLKLKFQYFGHLIRRSDSLEKTLMVGKIEGRRRRGQQSIRWLEGITVSMTWVWASSGSWWWTGKPGMLHSMGLQRVTHNWVTELNWTDLFKFYCIKRNNFSPHCGKNWITVWSSISASGHIPKGIGSRVSKMILYDIQSSIYS